MYKKYIVYKSCDFYCNTGGYASMLSVSNYMNELYWGSLFITFPNPLIIPL